MMLALALLIALGFEFVNGFHDTANAVATVIYTHSLDPNIAVVWSGICNLTGVLFSSGTVAFAIISLLPVELILQVSSGAGYSMIFALLIAAIVWNLSTWWFGLPASSSHTMVGSIIGVGLANQLLNMHSGTSGVDWAQATKVFKVLLISPLIGFGAAALLMLVSKRLIKYPSLYEAPKDNQPPPWPIRALLLLTCSGVSFSHGSNDGQKGMGLIMLILVGVVPGAFALNMAADSKVVQGASTEMRQVVSVFTPLAGGAAPSKDDAVKELSAFVKPGGSKATALTFGAIAVEAQSVADALGTATDFNSLSRPDRTNMRTDIYLVDESVGKVLKAKLVTNPADAAALKKDKGDFDKITKYIPVWVKVAVAFALGLGTMIGWKRIVVTVGEKIGKAHLTYAQGASAELVAYATIQAADIYGMPVSTTHVLSSGIAGTMAANGSGLQRDTLISILMAWVLTLPVCVFLGATLFASSLYVMFHVFGVQ
jgi:PiT family inorganic phosphate transporter